MSAWDERSGARERLYLLTRIGNAAPDPWIYNSVSDRWSNGTIGYKVDMEAEESRAVLRDRGLPDRISEGLIR